MMASSDSFLFMKHLPVGPDILPIEEQETLAQKKTPRPDAGASGLREEPGESWPVSALVCEFDVGRPGLRGLALGNRDSLPRT